MIKGDSVVAEVGNKALETVCSGIVRMFLGRDGWELKVEVEEGKR